MVTQSASEYAKIVFSDRNERVHVDLVNEDTISIVYTPKDGFVTEGMRFFTFSVATLSQ